MQKVNIMTPGGLHYLITELVKKYIRSHPFNYCTLNEVLGVLTAVSMELYRRVIGRYENQKIKQHGDVYPCTWVDEVE
jgi:hypothetical protein